MFDVFYLGEKPSLFAHERKADSIEHAQKLSRTRFFWCVTYLYDSKDWDWLFEPKPWQAHQRHAWPSQWQQDSGVYLIPKNWDGQETNYHSAPVINTLTSRSNWTVPAYIDESQFDFSWHPDLRDPQPYEYHFPTKWQHAGGPVFNKGAGLVKIVSDQRACSRIQYVHWSIPNHIEFNSVDCSWHPDPLDPPYIYHFPSQWQQASGVTYTVPGATEIKIIEPFQVRAVASNQYWEIPSHIEKVDLSWHPNVLEPPYVYHFSDQHQRSSGAIYRMPGAVEVKHTREQVVRAKPVLSQHWYVPINIDPNSVDYSWHPDAEERPCIYHFPSQWQPSSGVTYTVPGATEIKLLLEPKVKAIPCQDNWVTPDSIVDFDYSWHPNPLDPPYNHEFGTVHYNEGGPVYTMPGASEYNYVSAPRARLKASKDNWKIILPINESTFDWSWRPHPKEQPYIYVWGNQHWPAQKQPTVEYHVPGATQRKYMETQAELAANTQNWTVPASVDPHSVDYSWCPDPGDPPYIYEFGTQWQPNGGAVYTVPGAHEVKYVEMQHRRLPDRTNWTVPDNVDSDSVDYSWHPDTTEQPYIYEFGTQWQPNGGAVYTVPGATHRKYVEIQHRRLPDRTPWKHLEEVTKFDWSWHPDNTAQPYNYVFGNQHWPGTIMPTMMYCVPGATQETFVDNPVAQLRDCMDNWEFCEDIDHSEWDWTWLPNPKDPPYIYVFGNQWNPPEYKASLKYHVEGATEIKYMEKRTRRLPQRDNFECRWPDVEFDWSWEPNPFDPPMTYVFGNQWNPAVLESTVLWMAQGGDGKTYKYMDEPVAKLLPMANAFEVLDDIEEFDYSWRPNPTDPPYVYVFGNQWLTPEQRPAVQYRVGSATEIKYMDHPKARRKGNPEQFRKHYDSVEFDYSWEPDPGSPPYIYVFGNQWYPAEQMPTVEYAVPGATEKKYMSEPVAKLTETAENWIVTCQHKFEFDRSWRPEPGSPPYIYVFGNQWYPSEQMSTVEYHVPGATLRKFMEEPRAKLLADKTLWSVPTELNADNIDFTWIPDPTAPPYIYHFGTEYQSSVGLTYTVPSATDIKFAGNIPTLQKEKKTIQVQDIFYMDKSNAFSALRFKQLQERYPHIQKIRYVNSVQDTIKRCLNKTKQQRFWVVGSENDYSNFDFAWHAQPWQSSMTHVFGSQWNKWSDTFLINRWEFERHTKWTKSIEEFPNLNFVTDQIVHAPADAHNIYVIDFGNKENESVMANLESRYRVVKRTRYFDSYLNTLKRLLEGIEEDHIWVVGSVCDYSDFDFSWQPDAWQKDMLHVFPSAEQKFGDTFFVPVQALREKINDISLLDWFETVNYCEDQRVLRWPMPIIQHTEDTQVELIKSTDWAGPFALFTNTDYVPGNLVTVPLWRQETKAITPLSAGATSVIVPKDAVGTIKTQLYDYPYIDKTHRMLKDAPLDIVFISNGETEADYLYTWLEGRIAGLEPNRLVRVDGVKGRVAAYQAAARASNTPWFFAVFAKLQVNFEFDWSWQPDRMQQPKHYIFHARNPINGLVYGHQAMIAYNQKMTLENTGQGLDFTLDQPHEVVPILSGTAQYHTSDWMCWRTAFREALKLRASLPDVENEYRLNEWLTKDNTAEGWSMKGAQDAVEYYESVNGDFEALRKSYEWEWLASYAFMKRGLS